MERAHTPDLLVLPADEAAKQLKHLSPLDAAAALAALPLADAGRVLAEMPADDRVDVLDQLSPLLRQQMLATMSPAKAAEARDLQQYPPDTAGGIMTTEVAALPETLTAAQAIEELRRLSRELEQLYYVYVIDGGGRLGGVLSMRDLILAEPGSPLKRIMRQNVAAVSVAADQEDVAHTMHQHGYLAMPVVDDQRRLLGIITVDDIVDVLEEEATEDVQRMFGAGPEERLTSSWSYSFRKRIGWLQVNLVTAFIAASVVGLFEDTIAKFAVLAVYMPVVAGMGGNASAQAMAVAIRGIALGEVDRKLLRHVLKRELIVGVLSGLCVGATAAVISMIFHHRHGWLLGLLAGGALLINHSLACVWGVTVPFVMKRLGFDPAQSATIFTTTLTDMVGFFTLLGLATLAMSFV
jgi:magnesium transporter